MFSPKSPSSRPGSVLPDGLSFETCLAKTRRLGDAFGPGRDVFTHCRIVGELARALALRCPPDVLRDLFPDGFPLAAASHDIGKISPSFYTKLCNALGTALPPNLRFISPSLEQQWGGHAGVSQLAAAAMGAPRFVPEILGQHHGFAPQISSYEANDDVFGGKAWQTERVRLVEKLKDAFKADWPRISTQAQARFLAGLTSVADWIGSGEPFDDPSLPWEPKIEQALDAAGFIRPNIQSGLSFEDLFGFPEKPAQKQLIDRITQPGIYVFEAPMGIGKTEAALYASYRMLEKNQAAGVYFALPTQLTSNKIYERFTVFLDKILRENSPGEALLLHSNAWLYETEMGKEGLPGGDWFHQSKRGLLAPFAVGTVDQALMAAMNVKHGFVRAFGLAGKVVILDEIHTYDAYTGVLLDELVDFLRQLHCTVIILSATLSKDRRAQLLRRDSLCVSNEYPLITALPANGTLAEVAAPTGERKTVAIRMERNEAFAVDEALRRAQSGQQILWIENTVAEAQKRYLDLAARAANAGVSCGLLHSRFTVDDRARREVEWVDLFGKAGWPTREAKGRILVGTQVLEQSLDIDADFLISRFCPTDMLLQRLGRLWRHAEAPRAKGSRCETWLLAPELPAATENPGSAFGLTAAVYSPYVLCRSLAIWTDLKSLNLPDDIRSLIEATYEAHPETGPMQRWLDELENGSRWRLGRRAMRQLACGALAKDGKTLPESKVQTRYSETESIEVLLLGDLCLLPERKVSRLTLLSGEQVELPWRLHSLNKREWRQLSARLMRQVVKVRPTDAPQELRIDTLEKYGLQNCFYLGRPDRDEAVLRVALKDEIGALRSVQGIPPHDKYALSYRDDLGYRVIKKA
ncbi:CRISPR-associated helicase/endonuclease Cas3 [Alphaproteobacteria bacterium]|nr:CRISPR-associated helicase/endonuclease Cas3 [Alphaproteobacteria bacterium]